MDVGRLLLSAQLEAAPARHLLLPWETGLAGVIFGGLPPLPALPAISEWKDLVPTDARQPEDVSRAVVETGAATITTRPFKRLKGSGEGRDQKEERLRSIHVRAWLNFALLNPAASRAGLQLEAISDDALRIDTMEEILYDRRTATLAARISALTMFTRWATSHGIPPHQVTPVQEELAYKYVSMLHAEASPPTRASRFREAVALALHILGMEGNVDVLNSRRITGSSLRSLGRKRLLLQRDPLRVEWVELLEHLVVGNVECPPEDQIIAGHALWLLYARSRHWDSQFVISEPSIEGRYVEASTSRTKTSNRRGRRNKALVLVGVAKGLLPQPWACAWLALRKEVSLSASNDQALLPGATGDGGWSAAAVESGAFGMHLRELLMRHGGDPALLWNIGSHSLKATVLSWVAKAGVLKEHRRVLGYHEDPGDRSVFGYSRDIFAVPLREMEGVLEAIADRRFLPDASRSGYWQKEIAEALVEPCEERSEGEQEERISQASTPRLPSRAPPSDRLFEDLDDPDEVLDDLEPEEVASNQTQPESPDDDSMESSSSSDGSEEPTDDVVVAGEAAGEVEGEQISRTDISPASMSNGVAWANSNTLRIHFGRIDDASLLACGRPIGPQHSQQDLHKAFVPGGEGYSKCKTCFGQIRELPSGLENLKDASIGAVLGDEEMLSSFFEVLGATT